VGDFRVVFKVIESEVWIPGIRHRKSIYTDIGKGVEGVCISYDMIVFPEIDTEHQR
jgi:hypothetical protein